MIDINRLHDVIPKVEYSIFYDILQCVTNIPQIQAIQYTKGSSTLTLYHDGDMTPFKLVTCNVFRKIYPSRLGISGSEIANIIIDIKKLYDIK